MSPTDYIIDVALILVILLRIREQPLTRRGLVRPFVFLGIAVAAYLHGLPSAGGDLVLLLVLALIGATIGTLSGRAVRLRRGPQGDVLSRAGAAAVGFWMLGMGARMAFVVWETHGGAGAVARFSLEHGITGADAWTAAVLAMAVAEVGAATIVQAVRGRRIGVIGRQVPTVAQAVR